MAVNHGTPGSSYLLLCHENAGNWTHKELGGTELATA